LGMRYSLDALVAAGADKLDSIDVAELAKFQAMCVTDPSFVPESGSLFAGYDDQLCGLAVNIAAQRHSGKLETAYSPFGQQFYQVGKDLSDVKYVIGVGGAIIYSSNPGGILAHATASANEEIVLKPKSPKFLADKKYIFAAMGLLSRVNKNLALKILESEITEV